MPLILELSDNVATGIVDAVPVIPDHLVITSETLSGVDTRQACMTIIAGTGVVIESGAVVTFQAADLVALSDGFSVEGGTFSIEMQRPAGCP